MKASDFEIEYDLSLKDTMNHHPRKGRSRKAMKKQSGPVILYNDGFFFRIYVSTSGTTNGNGDAHQSTGAGMNTPSILFDAGTFNDRHRYPSRDYRESLPSI